MPILAIMIPYIVWTMIMYAVIIMTYHSGDNHNVASHGKDLQSIYG